MSRFLSEVLSAYWELPRNRRVTNVTIRADVRYVSDLVYQRCTNLDQKCNSAFAIFSTTRGFGGIKTRAPETMHENRGSVDFGSR